MNVILLTTTRVTSTLTAPTLREVSYVNAKRVFLTSSSVLLDSHAKVKRQILDYISQ